MKTPLEALDEAILKLTALREIVNHATDVEATLGWDGMAGMMLFHFYRPAEDSISGKPVGLARALGGNWMRSEKGAWESELCGIPLFIHNAEPARNPQPEAVEL